MKKVFRKGISMLLIFAIALSIITIPTKVNAVQTDYFGTWKESIYLDDNNYVNYTLIISDTNISIECQGKTAGVISGYVFEADTLDWGTEEANPGGWGPMPVDYPIRYVISGVISAASGPDKIVDWTAGSPCTIYLYLSNDGEHINAHWFGVTDSVHGGKGADGYKSDDRLLIASVYGNELEENTLIPGSDVNGKITGTIDTTGLYPVIAKLNASATAGGKARFRITVLSGVADNIQIWGIDEIPNSYDLIKGGYWGPATGIDLTLGIPGVVEYFYLAGLPGTYKIQIELYDINTSSIYMSKTLDIKMIALGGPLTFTDSSAYDIPASTVGTAITDIDVSGGVSGGTTPYTFSATGLPAGIDIDPSTGIISGTPTGTASAGTATITVTDNALETESITISYGAISESTTEPIYTITSGAKSEWKKETTEGLIFISDGDYGDFTSWGKIVKVDGVQILLDDFDSESGSTKVILKPAYLETLALGEHTLEIAYRDGSAYTTFTIVKADTSNTGNKDTVGEAAKTGDAAYIALASIIALLSLAGFIVTFKIRKKRV